MVGRDRAVVLGGSMAGLLAARVLSDSFREVVVVDRDVLAGVRTPRRGVPQGHHAHALLARGQQVFEELFPGFTDQLRAAGKPIVDMGEMQWYLEGVRVRNVRTGLAAVSLTRPFLENLVRERVAAIGNVVFRERTEIDGLVATAGNETVIGARVRGRDPGSAAQILSADLVVDATGRGSHLPVWLAELGYQRPPEEKVVIGLSYTTCTFELPERPLRNDWSIIPLATPNNRHGAFFGRVDGDTHLISFTSMLGENPECDWDGVLGVAKSLPIPDIYQIIKDAEPKTGPEMIRFPASVWRHYEKLPRFPRGLLVLGDSICSFNPVYGQGMTVSSLEALELRRRLAAGPGLPDPLAYLRAVAKIVASPWASAAGGDLAWPGVEGRKTRMTRIMNAYLARLMAGMLLDPRITLGFLRVAGMVDPPTRLLRPGMVVRVLRASRRLARTANGATS
jgi:2-polyprenyl-6-methoxyphenol hydroxylase-like FAD-dependent oxidoreductase